MLYNREEVLSDQFDHFKLILFWVTECFFCKKFKENGTVGFFSQGGWGGVGHPFPLLSTIMPTRK